MTSSRPMCKASWSGDRADKNSDGRRHENSEAMPPVERYRAGEEPDRLREISRTSPPILTICSPYFLTGNGDADGLGPRLVYNR